MTGTNDDSSTREHATFSTAHAASSSIMSACNDTTCENVPPPPSPEQPPNAPHDPVDPGPRTGGQVCSQVFAADGYKLRCDWSKLGSREKMLYAEIPS
jgi:hypothetical protein